MSNSAPEPPYSVDTSSLMEWQARYYPPDVFPSVAANVATLITAGRFLVVTQETPAAEKRNPKRTHFIPDVCRELGIPSISFLGLMRREGWKF